MNSRSGVIPWEDARIPLLVWPLHFVTAVPFFSLGNRPSGGDGQVPADAAAYPDLERPEALDFGGKDAPGVKAWGFRA